MTQKGMKQHTFINNLLFLEDIFQTSSGCELTIQPLFSIKTYCQHLLPQVFFFIYTALDLFTQKILHISYTIYLSLDLILNKSSSVQYTDLRKSLLKNTDRFLPFSPLTLVQYCSMR